MAWNATYTFVALDVLTATQLNGIQANLNAIWIYDAAGQIAVSSAANTLAKTTYGGWTKIATQTITTAAKIDFTSLTGTWRAWKLIFGGLRTNTTSYGIMEMILNNDTGNNYYYNGHTMIVTGTTLTGINGNGVAYYGLAGTGTFVPANNAGATFGASGEIFIYNPTQIITLPTFSSFLYNLNSTGPQSQFAWAQGVWNSNAGINQVTLLTSTTGNTFSQGWCDILGIPA